MNENREPAGPDAGRVADDIRHVTACVQNRIANGERSTHIDADDLVEVLLAIADELDPFPPPG